MGKPHMRDVLVNHLKDRLFHLVHGWVSPYFCERPVTNPSIWKESLTWIVPRIRFVCWRNWKEWHIGCRHRGVGNDDASEIYSTRLIAKEVIFPKENGKLIFPAADGRITLSGGDQDLGTSTLIRERPIHGESHEDFLGEAEGSLSPPQDSFPDADEAINDFLVHIRKLQIPPSRWTKSQTLLAERGIIPYSTENFNVSRATRTNLDVMQESRIDDYWNVDGSRDLSDSWTGFTQFFFCWETSRRMCVVRGWDWQESS